MGQKVNPIGLRLGINRTWDSRWFADARLRQAAARGSEAAQAISRSASGQAGISRIVIERPAKKARITIHTRASRRRHRQEGRRYREAAPATSPR